MMNNSFPRDSYPFKYHKNSNALNRCGRADHKHKTSQIKHFDEFKIVTNKRRTNMKFV